ncbi:MAG: hypothetical protein AABZ39_13305 [Spirochaetota bacterium]
MSRIRIIAARLIIMLIGICAAAAPVYVLIAHRMFTTARYPYDHHTVTEKRFTVIRKALPPNAVVGYINGNSTPFLDDTDLIGAAYYLTPSILIKLTNRDAIPCRYILVESKTNIRFDSHGFFLIASTNGIRLYRRNEALQ